MPAKSFQHLKLKLFLIFPFPLMLLLSTGALIRIYNLSHIFLYWDEPIHSVRIAYQPLSYVLAYNNASALFGILLHFLLPLGKIELMARLPSVIFGTLTIPAIYYIGKYFFSKKEGLAAAALVTFSPFLIRFSQYSRVYAMLLLFTMFAFFFFFQAATDDKLKNWILFLLFTIAAAYSHLMGFMTLTGIAVFSGIEWLLGVIKKKPNRSLATKKLGRFLLFSFLILFVAFLLYLPDINVKGFMTASVARARNQTPILHLLPIIAKKIFRQQLLMSPPYLKLMLFFILLGIIGSLKSYYRKIIFFLLYILVPFFIFIIIKPPPVNIQSSERYFIFILPVLILIAARGTVILSAAISSLASQLKPLYSRSSFISAACLTLFIVGLISGFDLKHYYLNFWRFGAIKTEKKVSDYLQENVKKDGFIFFYKFPASGHFLALNPLSKKIDLNQNESIIRNNIKTQPAINDMMIYRIPINPSEALSYKNVDLWAVLKLGSENQDRLIKLCSNIPSAKAIRLGGITVLHFMEKKEPLSRKYTQLTSMLLSLDLKSSKKKELHLLAAKSLLSSSQVREAYLELEKAKSIQITDITEETLDYPLVYRLLDGIFGLSRQKIFSQYLNWFYNDQIASRLLELGKEYHQQGNFQEALYAYSESLNLNHKYDHIISHRLFQLANQFYLDKDINKAISIYKKTLYLDPERLILRLFLAEAFKVKGLFRETERIYHSIFKDNSQKELFPKIVYQEPIIIIDKNNSEWRLIFRAKNGTHFSGDITADNKFKNIKTERFSKKRDTWTLNKGRLHFSMQMDKRKLKIIEFENKEKNPLSFNLKINNRAERDKILIISSGRSPDNIPFTIK